MGTYEMIGLPSCSNSIKFRNYRDNKEVMGLRLKKEVGIIFAAARSTDLVSCLDSTP